MKKFLFFLLFAALFSVLVALMINPQKYAECTLKGLNLWAFIVLPSLLPFFFLTLLLGQTKGANKLSEFLSPITNFLYATTGTSAAFISLMSYVSGYPLGAKLICEFYQNGLIDQKQAEKLSAICSTSGPSFVIGSVGANMLGKPLYGFIIYACHILSSVITGIILRKTNTKYTDNRPIAPLFEKSSLKFNLYDCALNVTLSCLCVGTLISVFYLLSEIAFDLKITVLPQALLTFILKDEKTAAAIIAGLFECTKGCFMLSAEKSAISLAVICALITFGGLSILVQQAAFLSKAKVRLSYFISAKLIAAIISFALCFFVCKVLPL